MSIKGRIVPEDLNLKAAQSLMKPKAGLGHSWRLDLLEIVEAVMLSLIAIATAWGSYQAARWNGRQGLLYGTSSRLRVEAAVAAAEGGQLRLLDVTTFNAWFKEKETGNERFAAMYVRKFSPEYRLAFDAWLRTRPFENPGAPVGPIFMPEYHNALIESAARLNQDATAAFAAGTQARVISEAYVRGSVMLAVVIFLVALAQRFKVQYVRVGLLVVATTVLTYTYPRARSEILSPGDQH